MAGKSFKGNLEILNLSDIFQSLAMNRHSGTLIVTDGKRDKKIYFAEGEVTLLSSSKRMRLGELLIAAGKITAEDLDLALKLQKQSRKKLGEILVEEGFCEEEEIFRLVRQQIEEEIYDLFLWRKAEFEFIADAIPEDMARDAPNLTRLSLNTNSLIMEAMRRLDEWNVMQSAVPSTKEVFVIADERLLRELEHPATFKVELVDGKTAAEGMAEKCFMSEFDLCRHLASLVQQGAIRALGRDELVDRAEEAYALNDFAAAAALYGRLAEHVKDEPKILVPLGDSLRRTGAEKQALVIYEQLAGQLEAEGRDLDRLRACYEAITQLDPSRHEFVRKLEELDLRLASGGVHKSRLVPVLVVAALVLGGVGVALRGRIAAAFGPRAPDGTKEEVAALLDAMLRAKAAREHEEWFARAVELWSRFPESQEMKKVSLPVLVSTEPPGFDVYVNGVFQNRTSLDQPQLECTYDPSTRVRVEIKTPKREGQESRLLWSHDFEDPKQWQGLVRVPLHDEPDASLIVDGWLDRGVHASPGGLDLVGPCRDGTLRAFRVEGRSLIPIPDLDGGKLGERGDVFGRPLVHGDRVLLGLVEGGLATIEPGRPAGERVRVGAFPAPAPVLAAPVVAGERVIFATTHGDVHGFPLAGGAPAWSAPVEAGVVHDLALEPRSGLVLVAGEDAAVYAFDPARGARAWMRPLEAPVDGPPLVVEAGVLVPLATGKLLVLDGATGAPLQSPTWTEPRGRRLTLLADPARGRVYAATADGEVTALDARTLAPAWTITPPAPSAVRPRMAVQGDRLLVSFDRPTIQAYELTRGRLVWQARFPEQAGWVNAPIKVVGKGFVVATSKNYVHLFDGEDL